MLRAFRGALSIKSVRPKDMLCPIERTEDRDGVIDAYLCMHDAYRCAVRL